MNLLYHKVAQRIHKDYTENNKKTLCNSVAQLLKIIKISINLCQKNNETIQQ